MRWPALVLLLTVASCAPRATPYRFRAPVVQAPLLAAAAVPYRRDRTHDGGWDAPRPAPRRSPRLSSGIPAPADPPPPAASPVAGALVNGLRAWVGRRDKRAREEAGGVGFAGAVLAELGIHLGGELAAATAGPALVAVADARGALVRDGQAQPLLGDLVVFDGYRGREPASLVGVVVGADERATVEFLYLGRGVVRRGYLNLAEPTRRRDACGRILNTILRPSDGRDPGGTPNLAGALFAGYIRLDQLARAAPTRVVER